VLPYQQARIWASAGMSVSPRSLSTGANVTAEDARSSPSCSSVRGLDETTSATCQRS
jgi:hypothetical protein